MKTKSGTKEAFYYFIVAISVGMLEIVLYHILHQTNDIKTSNMMAYAFGVVAMFVLLKLFVYNESKNQTKQSFKQLTLTILMHIIVYNAQCYMLEHTEAMINGIERSIIHDNCAMISKLMVNVLLYPFIWLGNRIILKGRCSIFGHRFFLNKNYYLICPYNILQTI